MLETAIKFSDEVKECKKFLVEQIAKSDMLDTMSDDEFAMLRKCMKLFDTALELTMEQAETIYHIDKKLDKLLEKKGS